MHSSVQIPPIVALQNSFLPLEILKNASRRQMKRRRLQSLKHGPKETWGTDLVKRDFKASRNCADL
jgi:hypothetical protein